MPENATPSQVRPKSPPVRAEGLAVALMLGALVCLALTSLCRKSVTVDEFQALPHGLAILKADLVSLDRGVPPLSKMLSALPVLLTSAELNVSAARECQSSWTCGLLFMRVNRARYQHYFIVARCVSVLFLVVTCLLTWRLARNLSGRAGGLLALAVVCFSPNLIAHGRLVTPDIYLAAAIVLSLTAFDRLMRHPGLAGALMLGVAIGAATLFKLTGVFLFVTFPLCALAAWAIKAGAQPGRGADDRATGQRWHAPPASGGRLAGDADGRFVFRPRTVWCLLLALVAGVFVINLGYRFGGFCTLLGHFRFSTGLFVTVQRHLPGWLPVPLPAEFVLGFDAQLADTGYQAYLLGKFNEHGFWYYYIVAFLVKTPAVVMTLTVLALLAEPRVREREMPLLINMAVFFLIFSFMGHKNIGIRYLLFLFPMNAVWIGRMLRARDGTPARTVRAMRVSAAAGVVLLAAGTVLAWPNYISYFNRLCGGSAKGHVYLLDSNLDWGQDLIALRKYMQLHDIETIDLAYFGRVAPDVYGIKYTTCRGVPTQRYVAISANFLWGRTYYVNGSMEWLDDPDAFAAWRRVRPVAVPGHSIYVFDTQNLQPVPQSESE